MSKAYKNFWSLNTDEAIVAGILRDETSKDIEVLMPLSAQMKDVDLFLTDIKTKKLVTIQVKGSRAYEPTKQEVNKYKDGSCGWSYFSKDIVHRSNVDYFIFLIYILEESSEKGRRHIVTHTITIPTGKLKELSNKYKKADKSGKYSFNFWINPKTKKAFDIKNNEFDVSEFLDKKGFKNMSKDLN